MDDTEKKQSCLKLEIPNQPEELIVIFVKGTWFPNQFHLSITDGSKTWTCNAAEEDVADRAANWDMTVADYVQLSETYLVFQQPGSVYGFSDAGNGCKRLSWTFEKEGTKLEWRWKCQESPDNKTITADILNFLLDSNIRLSDELVSERESHGRLKLEAEKCLEQSEKLSREKAEFESEIYGKFVQVLNSKKGKLRELRDRLSKQESTQQLEEEEEETTDKTESFDEASDEEENAVKNSSKDTAPASSSRGTKRK